MSKTATLEQKAARGRIKSIAANLLYPAFAIIAAIGVWYIAAAIYDAELILPAPHSVLRETVKLFSEKEFWLSFAWSFIRSLIAFVASFIGALALSLLASVFKKLGKFLSPLITILRAVPTMSVILLFILIVGSRLTPVLVSLLIIMPSMYASFSAGFQSVDPELLDAGRVYGLGNAGLAFKVLLPCAGVSVVETSAASYSLTLKVLIAAEVIVQTANSIGHMMNKAKALLATSRLMALTVVTVVICILIEYLIRLLKKKFEY